MFTFLTNCILVFLKTELKFIFYLSDAYFCIKFIIIYNRKGLFKKIYLNYEFLYFMLSLTD